MTIQHESLPGVFFTRQNSLSDAGEFARRSDQSAWQAFGNFSLQLPRKVQLSGDFYGSGDQPFNITTGFDNNGDGNFNDRPQIAATGTPGALQTPYGLLTSATGTAILGRNRGLLPWAFHLDANLQRAFRLTQNPKAEHPQTLTANLPQPHQRHRRRQRPRLPPLQPALRGRQRPPH